MDGPPRHADLSLQQSPVMTRCFTLYSSMSIEPPQLDIKCPTLYTLHWHWAQMRTTGTCLHELIGALLAGNPVRALKLRDNKGRSKITLPSGNGQVSASLVPGQHTLYWRRALAWELIIPLEDEAL